jgi:hypothetical protein
LRKKYRDSLTNIKSSFNDEHHSDNSLLTTSRKHPQDKKGFSMATSEYIDANIKMQLADLQKK